MEDVTQLDNQGVKLDEGFSLTELTSGGATFKINFDDLNENMPEEERVYSDGSIIDHVSLDALGLQDDDIYNDGAPFELLATKMTNLLEDGRIKKRILREGIGERLPAEGQVTCDYNAYIEYSDEPFDSTYLRNTPFIFYLNSGKTLPGLDMAVQSMKINEKAQFLIHYDFAYGKLGVLERVPPMSTVLFEIEVRNCKDIGAANSFTNLPEEEQKQFTKVYKYANALCLKGNDLFGKHCYKAAIREYNSAVSKLINCSMADYDEQEQQQALLFRLYTNLAVVYTKVQEPRKACIQCNEIFHMVKGTSIKVPAKVYFHNARALIMLGDYDHAERKLKIAKMMQPNDANISAEFIKLDHLKKENYTREVAMAKAIFKNNEINQEANEKEKVTKDLKAVINEYCEELKNSEEMVQFALPSELNSEEIAFIKKEIDSYGFTFSDFNGKYCISKPIDKTE